jgi:hypothetical protein
MNGRGNDQAAQARRDLGDIGPRLAALCRMTVGELREEFLMVYGFPTRSRNRDHLRKRVAWKIQADAEGGLSQRALERIEQLAPLAPVQWRPSLKDVQVGDPAPASADAGGEGDEIQVAAPAARSSDPVPRDPRLPRPGTIIVRQYRGRDYRVRILEDGFEYDGGFYPSLSKVAGVITGTNWNGFLFFKRALA